MEYKKFLTQQDILRRLCRAIREAVEVLDRRERWRCHKWLINHQVHNLPSEKGNIITPEQTGHIYDLIAREE